MKLRRTGLTCLILLLSCGSFFGCGSKSGGFDHSGTPRDNTPQVLSPSADGTKEYSNEYASIDVSNTSQGYVMAAYKSDCEKVKIQITDPNQVAYTYLLPQGGSYQTFPLTGGDGTYEIQVYENVSGDSYAIVLSEDVDVTIENEFLPYLYPNQYTNFTADSAVVTKGEELAKDSYSDLEVVNNVYVWVTENVTYDTQKAESVTYGYIPDPDKTLEEKTGICFDYASLMTSMLRSQGIPTKLDVGYSGEALHAWISTYVDDIGWVDNIIEFDGDSWTLLDPTLAASNNDEAVKKYVGDGNNYTLKYSY